MKSLIRVAVLISATWLKERLQQTVFTVNFTEFLKMLFTKHPQVTASAPFKDFNLVMFQILTNFKNFSLNFFCNPCFFVIFPL